MSRNLQTKDRVKVTLVLIALFVVVLAVVLLAYAMIAGFASGAGNPPMPVYVVNNP